jgi:hypothetical protein
MNQFSDLLDIREHLLINLRLGVIGTPLTHVRINGQTHCQSRLDRTWIRDIRLSLLDPVMIEIELREKNYSQSQETAILIESLSIDDFEIVPQWTQLASYANDHDFIGPTTYLGFNGVWRLDIPAPFYQWRHRTLNLGWLLEP